MRKTVCILVMGEGGRGNLRVFSNYGTAKKLLEKAGWERLISAKGDEHRYDLWKRKHSFGVDSARLVTLKVNEDIVPST